MARSRSHDSEGYEVTDAEKRDLIKLINEGKPLPEKYRFVIFDDKRKKRGQTRMALKLGPCFFGFVFPIAVAVLSVFEIVARLG